MTLPLFTIGYEGRSIGQFIDSLQSAWVGLLIDVREAPISRKPGFSKSALSAALGEAGIDYLHLRALGCPRPIRDRHREDGDWARYTADFLAHLEQQQPALDQLIDCANDRSTALLCFESDFNRCHRTYVARAAARRSGAEVLHITASGILPDAQSSRISPSSSPSQ